MCFPLKRHVNGTGDLCFSISLHWRVQELSKTSRHYDSEWEETSSALRTEFLPAWGLCLQTATNLVLFSAHLQSKPHCYQIAKIRVLNERFPFSLDQIFSVAAVKPSSTRPAAAEDLDFSLGDKNHRNHLEQLGWWIIKPAGYTTPTPGDKGLSCMSLGSDDHHICFDELEIKTWDSMKKIRKVPTQIHHWLLGTFVL